MSVWRGKDTKPARKAGLWGVGGVGLIVASYDRESGKRVNSTITRFTAKFSSFVFIT